MGHSLHFGSVSMFGSPQQPPNGGHSKTVETARRRRRELSCLSVGHGLNSIDCYLASNTFQTRMVGLFDVRLQKINDCGCTVNFLGQANLVAFGQLLDARSDV